MTNEIERQRQGANLVEKHILHNLCLTMEKELEEHPELLLEAVNFKEDEETGECPEIYEYWAITEWLAKKLEAKGEIIFDVLDFTVWGRQCTGQAINLDNVIQDIAEEFNF